MHLNVLRNNDFVYWSWLIVLYGYLFGFFFLLIRRLTLAWNPRSCSGEGHLSELVRLITFGEDNRSQCWNLRFISRDESVDGLNLLQIGCRKDQGLFTWNLDWKGQFCDWSYYACLRCASASLFPWKGVWGSKVPHKVAFYGQLLWIP